MPGSIRVLVMEAFNLPEAINDGEEVAIKVAVGSREFQTELNKTFGGQTTPWGLDYVFPVLNLRDNLSVMLLDKYGEKISQSEIDTPSIVEKGSFETNLLLNGGGKIHLSLRFVLTDEERRRIDIMRAAALKRREQESIKRTSSSQLAEKEMESIFQKINEPQSNQFDEEPRIINQEPSTSIEAGEEPVSRGMDVFEKSRSEEVISSQNNVEDSKAIDDQMSLIPPSTTQIRPQASPCTELEQQTLSENRVNSLGESAELNDANASPKSVKAKIKAFEAPRARDEVGLGPALSSTVKASVSSPQLRIWVDTGRERSGLSKEHHGDVSAEITEESNYDSRYQTGSREPVKSFSENNMTSLEPLEGHLNHNEKVALHKGEAKEIDPNFEHASKFDSLKPKEMDAKGKRSPVKAAKWRKMQIDLESISKQVRNGVILGFISGALLIAAGALLRGRNPKKRNRRDTRAYRQISYEGTMK